MVACGGDSRRMGSDKGQLVYHILPQRYHVYRLLEGLCSLVYLGCGKKQSGSIDPDYRFIEDDDDFLGAGPLTPVLTALKKFPGADILLVACDYPYLTKDELSRFAETIRGKRKTAAFYDIQAGRYIPVLGYYPAGSEIALMKWKDEKGYSLQQFLREKRAAKYVPRDPRCMISVDEPENAALAKSIINDKSG